MGEGGGGGRGEWGLKEGGDPAVRSRWECVRYRHIWKFSDLRPGDFQLAFSGRFQSLLISLLNPKYPNKCIHFAYVIRLWLFSFFLIFPLRFPSGWIGREIFVPSSFIIFSNRKKLNRMDLVFKYKIFQRFDSIYQWNVSKMVGKLVQLKLGYFFESKEIESNRHSLKMQNFPTF